jgi:predicted acylesterase/phospholipase RssA
VLTPARRLRTRVSIFLLVVMASCTSAPPRQPPPEPVHETVVAGGLPDARFFADDLDEATRSRIEREMRAALLTRWQAAGRPVAGLDVDMLALSGGGADGAFSAGLLTGWSERGDRPEFDLVTGISVGALVAPFAFLGSDDDDELRAIFTGLDTPDIAELRLFSALFGALSLARTDPLRAQIERFVDDDFLARIAAEHRKGRRLLVGTTNIDAARPVIWNMGEIAEAGELELFKDVVLASASIPGAFPPVEIEVEAGDHRYTELHVDGGVGHMVLIGPTRAADALPQDLPFPVRRTIYVIMNVALVPPYQPVEDRLLAIVGRSLSTLIRAHSDGDLIRIYLAAGAAGADFRLTFLPPGFQAPPGSPFDRAYMTRLFETAYEEGRRGVTWLTEPPAIVGRRSIQGALGEAGSQARQRLPEDLEDE